MMLQIYIYVCVPIPKTIQVISICTCSSHGNQRYNNFQVGCGVRHAPILSFHRERANRFVCHVYSFRWGERGRRGRKGGGGVREEIFQTARLQNTASIFSE